MRFKHQMKVYMGKDMTGKPLYQWAVGNTDDEFVNSIGRLYVEREGYKPPEKTLKPEPEVRLFSKYAEIWLGMSKSKNKPNTYNVYKSMLKIWMDVFSNTPVVSINPTDVQHVLNSHSDKHKNYLTTVLNILQQTLEYALEDGVVSRNVARSKLLFNPGVDSKERRVLTDEELLQCINKLQGIENQDDKLCAAIHIFTGMRPGEVLGLEWQDIDFEKKKIYIQRAVASYGSKGFIGDTKTRNGKREVDLLPMLEEVLKPHRGSIGPLFSIDGKPYGQYQRAQMATRIEEAMCMGHIIPYTFRHTFATKAYELGVKDVALSEWMGHSDISITRKYYIHDTDQLRSEASSILQAGFEGLAVNCEK